MIARRAFFAGLLATPMLPAPSWAALGSPVALSAAMTAEGQYLLVGLDAVGGIAFDVPLPARGHAAAAHPVLAEAVAIARRPGTFAKVIDCATGTVRQELHAPSGRHFYGHGAFSADGTLLFTTENEVETGAGRIGVWDRRLGYARIDDMPSHGIGPHEILRLPSGDLAVANGGIRTHPATGRDKLNLATMRPNLAILSPEGQLKTRVALPVARHQNSLRHIAADASGRIVCGFQWQGDPGDTPPLVAIFDGQRLIDAEIPEPVALQLEGYIGSVCAMGDGLFAASAPRGRRVIVLDHKGAQRGVFTADDICGVARAREGGTLATTGFGHAYALSDTGLRPMARHGLAFDNHLVAI